MSFTELPTWMLSQAQQRAHTILADRLAQAGARGYEFRILDALAEHAPLSQVAVGSLARLDRRDVTVTLTALSDAGLIERHSDPEDARRNVVTLTESGRARFEELSRIVADAQEAIFDPLDDDSRTAFLAALRILAPVGAASDLA